MVAGTLLKGHSPQAYSRDANKFGELLCQCRYMSFVRPGSYHHKGAKQCNVTFSPSKVPNMLVAKFQDGQGTYMWHATITKGVSQFACAQEAACAVGEWFPEIQIKYRNFPATNNDKPIHTQETALSQNGNACHFDKKDPDMPQEGIGEEVADVREPTEKERHTPPESADMSANGSEILSDQNRDIVYDWQAFPDDLYVYKALEEAALEEDSRVILRDTYIEIRRLYEIVKKKTHFGNTRITASTRRLAKEGILLSFPLNGEHPHYWKLMFIKTTPDLPDDTRQKDAKKKEQPAMIQQSPRHETVTRSFSSSLRQNVVTTIMQALQEERENMISAYAVLQKRAETHSQDIQWILERFTDVLTPDEKETLENLGITFREK